MNKNEPSITAPLLRVGHFPLVFVCVVHRHRKFSNFMLFQSLKMIVKKSFQQ
jgi:hypothetical protein